MTAIGHASNSFGSGPNAIVAGWCSCANRGIAAMVGVGGQNVSGRRS